MIATVIAAVTARGVAGVCLLGAALAAGCAHRPPAGVAMAPRAWRGLAMPADRVRLRDWREAFVEGLGLARQAGHGGDIAREGALLEPDSALPDAALADGLYDCRVIKLGGKAAGGLHYIAYPRFDCRVGREDGLQHFAKLGGSQRPVGHLYPESPQRTVFLGTLMLGDEQMAMRYGQDRERDMAGVVERVGPRQWRLVLPYPRFESVIDVVELVPKG